MSYQGLNSLRDGDPPRRFPSNGSLQAAARLRRASQSSSDVRFSTSRRFRGLWAGSASPSARGSRSSRDSVNSADDDAHAGWSPLRKASSLSGLGPTPLAAAEAAAARAASPGYRSGRGCTSCSSTTTTTATAGDRRSGR